MGVSCSKVQEKPSRAQAPSQVALSPKLGAPESNSQYCGSSKIEDLTEHFSTINLNVKIEDDTCRSPSESTAVADRNYGVPAIVTDDSIQAAISLKSALSDRIQVLSLYPRIVVFDNFLSDSECEQLMKLGSSQGLERSKVGTGARARVSNIRDSESAFLKGEMAHNEIVKKVEDRIEEFSGLRCDETEPIQIIRYREGMYYSLHFDNGSSIVTRAVTCILYLNDVDEGGETYFPKAIPLLEPGTTREEIRSRGTGPDFTGVKIFPGRGKALFFWSKNREGTEENRSCHSSEKVVSGTKWIATKWLKDD